MKFEIVSDEEAERYKRTHRVNDLRRGAGLWRRSTASTARTEEGSSLAAYPGSGSTVSARYSWVTQLTANGDAAHGLRSLDSAIRFKRR
jgi:hypothetical protein